MLCNGYDTYRRAKKIVPTNCSGSSQVEDGGVLRHSCWTDGHSQTTAKTNRKRKEATSKGAHKIRTSETCLAHRYTKSSNRETTESFMKDSMLALFLSAASSPPGMNSFGDIQTSLFSIYLLLTLLLLFFCML